MSLDIVVEKYNCSIPMELVTGAMAEAIRKDGIVKGASWTISIVLGIVVVLFLVWKSVREIVKPAQLEQLPQLVQPTQPELLPAPVQPQQIQQAVQNEQIDDEPNEQGQPAHPYNLRPRQSRSPPSDRQAQQQDQGNEEHPTLYIDHNGQSSRQRISASAHLPNARKLTLKHNTHEYTHKHTQSAAEYLLIH